MRLVAIAMELLREAAIPMHVVGWGLLYSLALGGALVAALRIVLLFVRGRSAWARYALCCGTLVLVAGVGVHSWTSLRSAYDGHEELVRHYAVEAMRNGAPATTGALPGGWTPEELASAVERRHDQDLHPWLSGAAASGLGAFLALLAGVWLVVAAARLLDLMAAVRSLHRLATMGTGPAAPRWHDILATLQRRLGVWHPVTLAVSPHVDSPILVGWWRPTILLPTEPHERLDDDDAEAVLAHELAHVRRGDYAVNLLQSVAEAVLFFNPAVWWLGERIRDEREFCSDDLAHRTIGGTLSDYLNALATLEGLRGGRVPEPAVGASGRSLLRRIRRLVELAASRSRPRPDIDLLLVAALLVALWVPALRLASSVEGPAVAVMKHEMRLRHDYEEIARDGGLLDGRRDADEKPHDAGPRGRGVAAVDADHE